jgi:hypothetical protein
MPVLFNSPEAFLEELGKDKDEDEVHRRIVRLTYLSRPSKMSANISHLYVVATARVAGETYRLECYCGDIWRIEVQDKPVQEKVESVCNQVMEGCAKLGLEVRAGVSE